jgi:hypothetical protein
VSVDVAVAFACTLNCGGLKLQATPAGAPLHARLTCPLKPPVEFTVTVKFDALPAAIVIAAGATEPLSPPALTCTS